MKFIKLTSKSIDKPIYLNVAKIGDITVGSDGVTVVGHETHNNGGFRVLETPLKVLDLISEMTGITCYKY